MGLSWNMLSVSDLTSKFVFVFYRFCGYGKEIIRSLKLMSMFSLVWVFC